MSDAAVNELKKFQKNLFNIDSILSTASELKYNKEIKQIMLSELSAPSEAFVRHFGKQIYNGPMTAKVLEQFTAITKKSLNQLINEMISDRLKSALANETAALAPKTDEALLVDDNKPGPENKIITTEVELEGYYIVKSMLRAKVDSSRITHRDAQSYFSVLLDDNNRRPICRLWLNGGKKYISVFDEQRKEAKIELTSIDDIYKYADMLLATALSYDSKVEKGN